MIPLIIAGVRIAVTAALHHTIIAPVSLLGELLDKHKGVRRGLAMWAAGLITWVTVRIFKDPSTITAYSAEAYAATCAILGTVLSLYHLGRNREDYQIANGEVTQGNLDGNA